MMEVADSLVSILWLLVRGGLLTRTTPSPSLAGSVKFSRQGRLIARVKLNQSL